MADDEIINRCVVCGVDMGSCNPRQYCMKLYCPLQIEHSLPPDHNSYEKHPEIIDLTIDDVQPEIIDLTISDVQPEIIDLTQ